MNIFKKNKKEEFDSKFVALNQVSNIADTYNTVNVIKLYAVMTGIFGIGLGLISWQWGTFLSTHWQITYVFVILWGLGIIVADKIIMHQIIKKNKALMTTSSQQLFQDIAQLVKTREQEEFLEQLILLNSKKQYDYDFVNILKKFKLSFKEYNNGSEVKNEMRKLKTSLPNLNIPRAINQQEKYKELI